MKHNQLVNLLTNEGCYLLKHGKKHDVWFSPTTGRKARVPRHGSQEIKYGTLTAILKTLLGH